MVLQYLMDLYQKSLKGNGECNESFIMNQIEIVVLITFRSNC